MTEIPQTVTRIDIVGSKSGRLGEFWADEWEVSVQDDGKTVKFFAKGDGGKPRNERNASLGRGLVEDWHGIAQTYS